MSYFQGFVCAVPTRNRAAFINHARLAAEGFRDHGCLEAVECWGDDVPPGKVTSFPMAVKAEPVETVVFSWYRWPSKEVHDTAMRTAMSDPRLSPETNPMPFDGKRVIFGGFAPLLEQGNGGTATYVDGYLLAVPEANRDAYRAVATEAADRFAELGALRTVEAWGDALPDGKVTDFRRAVQAEAGEGVVFSWVAWPDKATRVAAWKQFAEDTMSMSDMPFDGKRMIYGGFEPVVEV